MRSPQRQFEGGVRLLAAIWEEMQVAGRFNLIEILVQVVSKGLAKHTGDPSPSPASSQWSFRPLLLTEKFVRNAADDRWTNGTLLICEFGWQIEWKEVKSRDEVSYRQKSLAKLLASDLQRSRWLGSPFIRCQECSLIVHRVFRLLFVSSQYKFRNGGHFLRRKCPACAPHYSLLVVRL